MRRASMVVLVLVALTGCPGPEPSPIVTATAPGGGALQPLRPRAAHSATLLGDGRVLIAGGCAEDGCSTAATAPTSEFYLAGFGFIIGPPMVHPRHGHTATRLADGRVLFVGGFARAGTLPIGEAEVFDPFSASFRPAGRLEVARVGHTATLLPDGRVLVAGGWAASGDFTRSVEIFDPITNGFAAAASMPGPRHAAAAVGLPDGDVLIIGGAEISTNGLDSTVIYHAGTGEWRPGPRMSTARFEHAATTLADGRIIVLGGTTDGTELLASTEILDGDRFVPGPPMSVPRHLFVDAVARSDDGHLVVAGGPNVDVLSGAGFDVDTAGRRDRSFATATGLPDGRVLIVGGYDERIRVHDDALLISAAAMTALGAGRDRPPGRDRTAQPPAIAPRMMNGSAPATTRSGSGASGGSLERSSSQA